MSFKVIFTEEFQKEFLKIDLTVQKEILNIANSLKDNPNQGKILKYAFFREKKIRMFRFFI